MGCGMIETSVTVIGAIGAQCRRQCFTENADTFVTTTSPSQLDAGRLTHEMHNVKRAIYLLNGVSEDRGAKRKIKSETKKKQKKRVDHAFGWSLREVPGAW